MYVEESVVLDCHALQARNDASVLPLGDVAALCIYVEESFALDCHALQARNDASVLPLGDVASFIIKSPQCLSVLGVRHHCIGSANRLQD